jgi:hypothetical protein
MLGLKTKTFAPNCPPVVDGATTPAADAAGAAAAAGIVGTAAKQAPTSVAAAIRATRRASRKLMILFMTPSRRECEAGWFLA